MDTAAVKPLLTFKSHIEGRNADVTIYPDRIEWIKPRLGSLGKMALGVATGGASLLVTGVNSSRQKGFEMIPVKSISSVKSNRDGIMYTKMSVICSGNTIDFRVAHSEAQRIQSLLTSLILGNHASQAPQPSASVAQPPASRSLDVPEQLRKLAELRDAGVLTDDEFQKKKAEMLARM